MILKLWGLVIMLNMLANAWTGRSQEPLIVSALVLIAFVIMDRRST